MIESHWQGIEGYDASVNLDEYILMPNHLHGIILLTGYAEGDCSRDRNHSSLSVSQIIQRFKSVTTMLYIKEMMQRFPGTYIGKLWQRGFFDRIIRNEYELNQKREYIHTNPLRYQLGL